MSKELTITISGEAESGKSTMAATIAAILVEAGFNVELNDLDVDIDGLIEYLGPIHKQRMDALKQAGLEVVVDTIQTTKPLVPWTITH